MKWYYVPSALPRVRKFPPSPSPLVPLFPSTGSDRDRGTSGERSFCLRIILRMAESAGSRPGSERALLTQAFLLLAHHCPPAPPDLLSSHPRNPPNYPTEQASTRNGRTVVLGKLDDYIGQSGFPPSTSLPLRCDSGNYPRTFYFFLCLWTLLSLATNFGAKSIFLSFHYSVGRFDLLRGKQNCPTGTTYNFIDHFCDDFFWKSQTEWMLLIRLYVPYLKAHLWICHNLNITQLNMMMSVA